MNEAETRAELIDPALKTAGWGVIEHSRIRRELIAPGRLIGNGKRASSEFADYVLVYRGEKLAVIEAKKRDLPDTEGLDKPKNTPKNCRLDCLLYKWHRHLPSRYAHRGRRLHHRISHPRSTVGSHFSEDNQWRDRFAAIPFEDKSGTWEARYYQHNAIKHVLEAICQGKDRILLTMATGTGKTFIAFQLAWKLFQSRWNLSRQPTRRPRILFLADRNILANQAYNSSLPSR
jgi:type I restriction enzyme R subunit